MTWSKFDDLYDEHDKVAEAWERERAAVGLHVMATTHCNRLLTDGVVTPRWLRMILPERRERDRVLAVMVDTGLFDLLAAGDTVDVEDAQGDVVTLGPFPEDRYVVHDFLDRHDSRARVKERRMSDAARKRNPSGVRADSKRTPTGIQAESDGIPARVPAGARAGARVPTRPDPTYIPPSPPPGGRRKRDMEKWERHAIDWARSLGARGTDDALLRSVRQSACWTAEDQAGAYREFVEQSWPELMQGPAVVA